MFIKSCPMGTYPGVIQSYPGIGTTWSWWKIFFTYSWNKYLVWQKLGIFVYQHVACITEKGKSCGHLNRCRKGFDNIQDPVAIKEKILSKQNRQLCLNLIKGIWGDSTADTTPVGKGWMLFLVGWDEGWCALPLVPLNIVPEIVVCGIKKEKLINLYMLGWKKQNCLVTYDRIIYVEKPTESTHTQVLKLINLRRSECKHFDLCILASNSRRLE